LGAAVDWLDSADLASAGQSDAPVAIVRQLRLADLGGAGLGSRG